jgi:myo-inositol-1(or 4)-monophosphatase
MITRLSAIIKRAGQIMLSADLDDADIRIKSGPGDFVTRYDRLVQDMLCEELHTLLPEADFVGEESGLKNRKEDGYCFIVDPIDGTTILPGTVITVLFPRFGI